VLFVLTAVFQKRGITLKDIGELFESLVLDLSEVEIEALCDRLTSFISEQRAIARADPVAAE